MFVKKEYFTDVGNNPVLYNFAGKELMNVMQKLNPVLNNFSGKELINVRQKLSVMIKG